MRSPGALWDLGKKRKSLTCCVFLISSFSRQMMQHRGSFQHRYYGPSHATWQSQELPVCYLLSLWDERDIETTEAIGKDRMSSLNTTLNVCNWFLTRLIQGITQPEYCGFMDLEKIFRRLFCPLLYWHLNGSWLVTCFTLPRGPSEPLSFGSLWTGQSVNVISKHDFTDVRFIIEIF